jgi:glycosyltransferase involved in cell wall biosynthesis
VIEGKILFAPNVHTGGGWVLLKALLLSNTNWSNLILDKRTEADIPNIRQQAVRFFQSSVIGRFKAEFRLFRTKGKQDLLCFHSLPPMLPFKGNVSVFFQNVTILDLSGLSKWNLRVRLRSLVERCVFLAFRSRVDRFYVQTPSVKHLLLDRGGISPDKVLVFPFDSQNNNICSSGGDKRGFVYIADGISHKNHENLIYAWSLLALRGRYPKLTLTLGKQDAELWAKLQYDMNLNKLDVENVGYVSFAEIERLYQSAEALIFPSLNESFGLPLIEAGRYGLPVIASEKDYVRDVCSPIETFEPTSPRSIARAVCRFKGWESDQVVSASPIEFLQQVFSDIS